MSNSQHQVQVKCREQQMVLCIAFIDLGKAFDLLKRKGVLLLLIKINFPQNYVTSFIVR